MSDAKETISDGYLRTIYAQILNGYTKFEDKEFGKGYIRHLSNQGTLDLETVKSKYQSKVEELKLPSEKDQEELLDKEGIWTAEDKHKIAQLQTYVTNLKDTRSKLYLHSQIKELSIEIEKKEFELSKLLMEREEYMGHTSEKFVNRKVNEYYAAHIIYKDKEFKELKWSEEEWAELDDDVISRIITTYNYHTKGFDTATLKRVSLASFFTNVFYMCDNNPYHFYGIPIVRLTYFQIELFSFAMYYKSIMTDSKVRPPESIMYDPDKLAEWYETGKNAEEMLEKLDTDAKDGAVSLVGATKDDLKRLGMDVDKDPSLISLSSEAKKKGGKLDMNDFIELHGKMQ